MDTILLKMYSIEQYTDIIITHVQWYWIHTCYIIDNTVENIVIPEFY